MQRATEEERKTIFFGIDPYAIGDFSDQIRYKGEISMSYYARPVTDERGYMATLASAINYTDMSSKNPVPVFYHQITKDAPKASLELLMKDDSFSLLAHFAISKGHTPDEIFSYQKFGRVVRAIKSVTNDDKEYRSFGYKVYCKREKVHI